MKILTSTFNKTLCIWGLKDHFELNIIPTLFTLVKGRLYLILLNYISHTKKSIRKLY